MRVIVTGGSGFIGTNLVEALLSRKCQVLNLDEKAPPLPTHFPSWCAVSLLDKTATVQAVKEFMPDYIVHAAARTDLRGESLADYRANTEGTENLIAGIEAAGSVKRIIFMSTMLVCKNGYTPKDDSEYCPDTLYGKSKVEMEKLVRERMGKAGIEFVIVRPTSIWGPWFGDPYRQFFVAVQRGLYVHPGKAQIRKQFGYVGNVVDQLVKLLTSDVNECGGSVFYVGDYEQYVVREWADMVQRELGARRIRTAPLWLLKAFAKVGDALSYMGWARVPMTTFRLRNMLLENDVPFDNTERVCGALNHSIVNGVRQTVAWLKSQEASGRVTDGVKE